MSSVVESRQESCWRAFRQDERFVFRPCNFLKCDSCRAYLRKQHAETVAAKIAGTTLYKFECPDLTWDHITDKIRSFGGLFICFPRNDGPSVVFSSVPVYGATEVRAEDLFDELLQGFLGVPVGQRVRASRAWGHSDPPPPSIKNSLEMEEQVATYGYRRSWKEIREISEHFRLSLEKEYSGERGQVWRIYGLDDLNQYDRLRWASETGEYLVLPGYRRAAA